jgi:hypothetical protein
MSAFEASNINDLRERNGFAMLPVHGSKGPEWPDHGRATP